MDAENTHDENTEGQQSRGISRKTLLKAALIAPVPLLIGQAPALARNALGTGELLEPTPFCDDGDAPTIAQTEGPYFKPNSPLRSTLTGAGVPLTVSGYVFGRSCQPIANALLDFWQADNNGAYDNVGYTFRGHQFSDAQGAFKLTTIVPGLYPGRTRHIHVKVQAPNRPVLTTQLYFPNEPRNNTDTIFNPSLLMNVRTVGSGKEASFDFVLNIVGTPTPTPTPTPTSTPGGTWKAGTSYQAGDQVTYNNVTYRCLQAHTAYVGWEPPNVPALWQRV
ncbi:MULTISPECIES: carbohydrate-binding protein [Streptosporangium]|uniref:Protocatechuate 3,4-dioxygenase beta subunit n=1 Tax=Streptosporangium brasiliense TaxID=47480 RepID=A0ABT9RBD9_9ACTN|nr:carbohydrate-binding protein [Streptosporangium brasiliense]MDP9865690.1 protocatechuate 3,4-dioxygenase beta subunit [Streptosporangium brasiliense]